MGLDVYDFEGGFITRDLLGRLRSQKGSKHEKAIGAYTRALFLKVRGEFAVSLLGLPGRLCCAGGQALSESRFCNDVEPFRG